MNVQNVRKAPFFCFFCFFKPKFQCNDTVTYFFGHLATAQHAVNTTSNISPCKVHMAHVLANSCLVTYPADTRYQLCAIMFVQYSRSLVIFGLHQLLTKSVSLAAKCSTVFTSEPLTVSVCWLALTGQ